MTQYLVVPGGMLYIPMETSKMTIE